MHLRCLIRIGRQAFLPDDLQWRRHALVPSRRLWTFPESAEEGASHPFGLQEAYRNCDHFYWLFGSVHSRLRGFRPQALDGARRRFAGLRAEDTPELSGPKPGDVGKLFDVKILAQVAVHVREDARDAIAGWFELEHLRALRFRSLTPLFHDEVAGDGEGQIPTVIVLHEREGQVDCGRHASRRPYRSVPNEEAVALYIYAQEIPLQPLGTLPMRGETSAVRCARGGDEEGSGANARCASRSRRVRSYCTDVFVVRPSEIRGSHDNAGIQRSRGSRDGHDLDAPATCDGPAQSLLP
jgi:hypothetical protein